MLRPGRFSLVTAACAFNVAASDDLPPVAGGAAGVRSVHVIWWENTAPPHTPRGMVVGIWGFNLEMCGASTWGETSRSKQQVLVTYSYVRNNQ